MCCLALLVHTFGGMRARASAPRRHATDALPLFVPQRRHLSEYLAEITIQEFPYIKYKPSQIAASAVCLALHTVSLSRARAFPSHALSG